MTRQDRMSPALGANGLCPAMSRVAVGLPCPGLTAMQAFPLFGPRSYAVRAARRWTCSTARRIISVARGHTFSGCSTIQWVFDTVGFARQSEA